jgi:anti-sigma factor (TIGR02949 family)
MNKVKRLESLECRKVRRLLDDFLSDELSIEANQQILAHLDQCDECQEDRNRNEQVRKAMQRSWNSIQAPTPLRKRVSTNTHLTDQQVSLPIRIAAVVILGVVGVAAYFAFLGDQATPVSNMQRVGVIDHYQQIVIDHLRCSGRPARRLSLGPLGNQLASTLLQQPEEFKLVGAMDCIVEDSSFVHYVFRGSSGLLSVMFEARGADQVLPSRGKKVKISGLEVHMVHEGPLVLASVTTAHHFVYIVGDNFNDRGTLELTKKVVPSLRTDPFESG